MSLSTFHAVCRLPHYSVPLEWEGETQNSLFGDYFHHFQTMHKIRPVRPQRKCEASWRTPRRRPFTIGHGDVGDDVTWIDTKTGQTRHGQVWAIARGKDKRWVADGTEFHEVYLFQITEQRAVA